jgi:hypothetical protein
MKKGKVFFHPVEDTGPLTISWSAGPKGDAVEAKKGAGVGFFSDRGDLLCVIFDEVQSVQDHQVLAFTRDQVELTVKNGRVTYTVSKVKTTPTRPKKRAKRKQPA